MTYEVFIDDKQLFYPNDEEFVITEGTVENALNESGTFNCDIPKNNPNYEELENKVRSSMIQVKQNGKEIFYGEIRDVQQNFNMTKHIYAVGELAFLFDSIQPQNVYQCSPYEMFKKVIQIHNSQVEARKKFEVGYVSVKDSNNYIYRFTNYEDTLTVLREKLADTLDGFIRIRKVNNVRYLDLVPLENYGSYCSQEIQFGENLLDYSCNTSASDIATALIPLGKRLDDDERTTSAIEGLDEYLTIKGKENGYSYDKDYVFNQSAVNRFGWVKVVKHWDDVTTKTELKKKAEVWLKSTQYASMELQVNAFDGNLLDINVDSFDVGDTVKAWALPYGMDTIFPVRKKTTYINDVSKNYITLGSTYTKSYTQQASNAVKMVEEQLPEESEMLRSAKQNALAMLNGSIGGHVIFQFDESNKYVEQLLICNASTEKESTQKWVWNLNGLGYMSRKTTKDSWASINTDIPVAITMEGKIVADYITAGIMSADRMRGGTLEIGGNGTGQNGKIEVKNESGTTLITLDKKGMTLSGGQRISWNNISDKPDIPDNFNDLSGSITSTQISDNAVISSKINANAITSDKINANAITSDKINANAVTAGKINVSSLAAISASLGTVNVGGKNNGNGSLSVQDASGTEKVKLDNNGIKAEAGTIGGFTIESNNLHTGSDSNGVWIWGGATTGCPYGQIAVGTHGNGLIRLGYEHNEKVGILWEVNGDERYFVDLYNLGERI